MKELLLTTKWAFCLKYVMRQHLLCGKERRTGESAFEWKSSSENIRIYENVHCLQAIFIEGPTRTRLDNIEIN